MANYLLLYHLEYSFVLGRRTFLLFLAMTLSPVLARAGGARAADRLPGPIGAAVVRAIDGDTLVVRAHIWLGQNVETSVRLAGLDTPELRGKCASERRLAARAKTMTMALIADGDVTLRDIQFGKFAGRVVARVTTAAGADLSRALIAAGLGRPYGGGARGDWCAPEDLAP